MADMIAYNAVLHEPFVVKYSTPKVDIEMMSLMERHMYQMRNKQQEDENEY